MIDTIAADGTILCYVIRPGATRDTTTFFTPHEAELQAGIIVHPRGHEIPRHEHRPSPRHLTGTAEVLVVERGRCEIDIYDSRRSLVATRLLTQGDIVVLLRGGHGFRMLEDTTLIEVKQGPYLGQDEKHLF
jgi:mannose-6-phosphate isomerase-like protein (cupin superfamily)